MVLLAVKLSDKFKDWNIVIRPHPGEDIKIYEELCLNIDNIFVENKGPVSPWILASSVLIHNNCSTAIEANIGEIPVISYDPVPYANKVNIANHSGILCTSEREVFDVINKINENKEELTSNCFDTEDKDMLLNISKNSFDSFDLTVSAIDKSILELPKKSIVPSTVSLKIIELKRVIYLLVSYLVRLLFKNKMKFYTANSSIFYGLDKNVMAKKIEKIEKILGKRVECNFVSDHLLIIKGKE